MENTNTSYRRTGKDWSKRTRHGTQLLDSMASGEVVYAKGNETEGDAQTGYRRNSQMGLRDLKGHFDDVHGAEVEGVEDGMEIMDNVKEDNKTALANKALDFLPYRVSVTICAIAILPVFIIGILYSFNMIDWDYKIQTATGLSLSISLLDLLKERVITLTNNNLKNYMIPGRNFFQIGRELAFFVVWIPLSIGTHHWTSILGIVFEMCLAVNQALIASIKPEDVEETWARAFLLLGLGFAVPAVIYCFLIEKIEELEAGHPLPVERNWFSRAEDSPIGAKVLKCLGFAMKYQEQAASFIGGGNFGQPERDLDVYPEPTHVANVMGGNLGQEDPEAADKNGHDEDQWIVCNKHDEGAVPVFGDSEMDLNAEHMVPNPMSVIALSLPVIGTVGAIGSIILYALLYHDLSVDSEDDKYFGSTAGFEVSGYAVSGAQLMMVVGWMAVSILAGLAYVDREMFNAFQEVTLRPFEERSGFEYLDSVPAHQRDAFREQALKYPSHDEYRQILEQPFGVIEGVPRALTCKIPDARTWFAAIFANLAKYFIVVRALTFAVYDNDDQGFLMWYVVPEGLGVCALMYWFYVDSWSIMLANPSIRSGPTTYKRLRPAPPPPREVTIFEQPHQLWIEQAPGGGVRPMAGYAPRPVIPNVPQPGSRTTYQAAPGLSFPMGPYAAPPAPNTMPASGMPGYPFSM